MDKYAEGLAEGEARGEAEGRIDEKRTIAENLLEQGIVIEVVAVGTGLTLDEVEKTKADMNK